MMANVGHMSSPSITLLANFWGVFPSEHPQFTQQSKTKHWQTP